MSRALVLAAHGSRRDPAANAGVRRLAQAVRSRRLFDEVAVAFHQGEPGFETVLDELTADEVTVVPFMTSAGYYSDVVLPKALARNRRFGEVRLRQTPPVGTHPGLAPLIARRVNEALRENRFGRSETSLVLVGHGTPRHPESRKATLDLAGTLRRRRVTGEVLAAFLDDDPPLAQALELVTGRGVLVLPFLIGGGTHVSQDIPRLLGLQPEWSHRVILDHAIGTYPGLAEIIIDLARRHAPPPRPRFRPRGGRSPRTASGTVHLVGSGPGDPELITVRGLDLLRRADVVVHDRLIGPELLGETRPDAELIDVGKSPGHMPYSQDEINALLVQHARAGRAVVRLKGGDPFVFGRGSEELAACRGAGVPCAVVPGISSALAAPAAVGIPVTARGLSRSFAVVTAQQADKGAVLSNAETLASIDTLVILMGRSNLAGFAAGLVAAGRDPATPAACIQSATTSNQRVTLATLGTIADAADRDGLEAPVVTVVGAVAALAEPALNLVQRVAPATAARA